MCRCVEWSGAIVSDLYQVPVATVVRFSISCLHWCVCMMPENLLMVVQDDVIGAKC